MFLCVKQSNSETVLLMWTRQTRWQPPGWLKYFKTGFPNYRICLTTSWPQQLSIGHTRAFDSVCASAIWMQTFSICFRAPLRVLKNHSTKQNELTAKGRRSCLCRSMAIAGCDRLLFVCSECFLVCLVESPSKSTCGFLLLGHY